MGSEDSPTTWVPYVNNNQDCSQKICNLYCPQWCNNLPPPPLGFSDDDSGGAEALSPLVITIIGVFGSACLLISYYVIISRICIINNDSSRTLRRRRIMQNQETQMDNDDENDDEFNMEDDPLNLGPWHVPSKGLDECTINSIKACKYKKGDSLVFGTGCPVCLGEFQEDEKLRLLPKCSHAFHIYCIDTWLTNHSNCPLCRAGVNVMIPNTDLPPSPPPPPPPPPPAPPRPEVFVSRRDIGPRDAIIEIRNEESEREIRRSVSMSNLCQTRVFTTNFLFVNQQDKMDLEELQVNDVVGSSKRVIKSEQCRHIYDVGSSKNELNEDNMYANCGDHSSCYMMKRSYSSGRYLFIKGKKSRISNVLT